MKKQSDLSLLFNPFERIAGFKILIIGLILFVISTILAHIGGVVFNGVFSVQLIPVNLIQAFVVHGLSLIMLILVMYLAGLIFSASSIRFIDVAGTITFSRAPFVIVGAMVSIPIVNQSWKNIVSTILLSDFSVKPWALAVFIASTIVVLICLIWFVVLVYNAFSVSCNIKGMKNNIVFTVSLILTFVLSLIVSAKALQKEFPAIAVNNKENIENITVQEENFDLINETARRAAKDISQQNYDNVVFYFDDKMKEALPVEKLAEVMRSMEARFGKILRVDDEVKNIIAGENRIALIPVQFEKMVVNFRFTFNDKDQIIGFYM